MIITTENHGGQTVVVTVDINTTPLTATLASQGVTFTYFDRGVTDTDPDSVWLTDFDGRRWVLWAEPLRERSAVAPRRWWLALGIFDQSVSVGEYFAPQAAVKAAAMLVQAELPEVKAANEAGEFCARGADPRHDVRHCPGRHL